MKTIQKLMICICLVGSSLSHAEELPLKAFASIPLVTHVSLSPDGETIAYVQNLDGDSYLITQSVNDKPKAILTSDNNKFSISSVRWVNDHRLLVGVRYPDSRYGNQTVETRMLAINSDGTNLKADLLKSTRDVFSQRKNVPQIQDRILGKVKGDPDSVSIALDIDSPTQPDVYTLNLETERLKKVVYNPGHIYSWMVDRDGETRLGSGWRGTVMKLIVKAPGSEKWQTLTTYDATNNAEMREKRITPLGFDADPRFLYARANYQGKDALFRIDISKPDFPRELIRSDAKFDIDGNLIYAPWLKKVVGLRYSAEYGKRVYWDESARELQQQIDQALPRHASAIISSSDDGMRHIIASQAVNEAPRIYLLDRKTGKMSLLADTYPDLSKVKLPKPASIFFKSRDGMELHGYLTMPDASTASPDAKIPMILFPHGGPVGRDVSGFNYWTQFFVNHGWAVLQVNFRGSSGYGSDFEAAGFKRWGMEMQDDLTDGVDWAIRQGRIDPGKICIVGASYGGYAAMMGIVKTPNLYRCAVSVAGVADLRDLLASKQRYVGYEIAVERQIGEWWNDRARLRETSPVNRVKEIRTPLLLVHGKEDRVVDVEQSRDMASALKSAGNTDYRYVELPLGDHNLSREEDRIRTFSEMEKFLVQYLN